MRTRVDELAGVWLQPIAGGARAGEDARHDPDHEAARAEIAKLSGMLVAKVDWARVEQAGTHLLIHKTKDLGAATYVACALHERLGLRGLAQGLALLAGLLLDFGADLFPARMRARANALVWFAERCELALADTDGHTTDDLVPLRALTHSLISAAGAALGSDVPSLARLSAAIERLERSAAVVQPLASAPASPLFEGNPTPIPSVTAAQQRSDPPALVVPTANASTTVSSVLAGPGSAAPHEAPPPRAPGPSATAAAPGLDLPGVAGAPQEAGDLTAWLRRTGTSLVEAARSLRAREPANPRAYRLLRAGVWLHIDGPPAADADRRTRIPAPDKKVRDVLDTLFAKAQWELLLAQAEAMAARSPFWLDTHFLAARALEGLGATFAPAAAALTHDVRAFVERLPTLLELRFADGAALGSPAALTWLRRNPVLSASGTTVSASPNPGSTESSLPEALRTALRRGEPGAAQQVVQLMGGVSSLRAGFRLRLEVAELLCESAKLDQAIAAYLGLEQDLDAHALERWEPDLAIRVLRGLWWALEKSSQTQGSSHPEARRVCARLARLSPAALL